MRDRQSSAEHMRGRDTRSGVTGGYDDRGAGAFSANWVNKLFYGDNLDILRDRIPPESIDLIYLDPPFNSNRSYNVLFADKHGSADDHAQIEAFGDTWTWTQETE